MDGGRDAPIVRLRDVRKSFDHGRVLALRGIGFDIFAGETVAIVGRSGSGKTTLLNILCGLLRPDGGSVAIEGRTLASRAAWTAARARRIGLVFQDHHLLPTLTAIENVEIPMIGQVRSARQRRARARALLASVGMENLADRLPGDLSSGERQRAAIARGLVNRPVLLLADEPTGNLDRANANVVAELFQRLARDSGQTIVLVTHDPIAAAACARHVTLDDGAIVSDDGGGAALDRKSMRAAGAAPSAEDGR